MSLITCCPACGTMFKVVPDQLRISEGWVRCGHCEEVFDATAHLRSNGESVLMPSLLKPPLDADGAPELVGPARPLAQPERADPAAAEAPYPPFVLVRPDTGDEPEAGAALANAQAALEPQPPAPLPSASAIFAKAAAPAPIPQKPQADGDPQRDKHADADADAEPALEDVSFVRHARRRALWQRPGVRAALIGLLLALGAALAVQFALQERDRLAAQRPALRPALALLCDVFQCRLGAPRQIESVVIDASSFSKLRSEAYRLNFTLKNQAPLALAMPFLELTLTDTQDQAVVRKVLSPAEMGAASGVIAAASDWAGSLAIGVDPAANAGRIAGYRLLVFYP